LILVSDVALLGGYAPGEYKWGDLDVAVFPDGHLGLPGTTILAGAAHLLDWDLARFMEFTGHGLAESIALCTVNPARYLGIADALYGRLAAGAPAHLCLFRYAPGDERLRIELAVLDGEPIYGTVPG
jgi:N-acetylglucosamine-6-phosphate deacetylase